MSQGILIGREQPQQHLQLEADAVIVGSGAGGAVVACELAEAGLRVSRRGRSRHLCGRVVGTDEQHPFHRR